VIFPRICATVALLEAPFSEFPWEGAGSWAGGLRSMEAAGRVNALPVQLWERNHKIWLGKGT
jgi:hypothetical protein